MQLRHSHLSLSKKLHPNWFSFFTMHRYWAHRCSQSKRTEFLTRKHLHKQVGTTINRYTQQGQYFCITNFWNQIAHNTISFQLQNQSRVWTKMMKYLKWKPIFMSSISIYESTKCNSDAIFRLKNGGIMSFDNCCWAK
jgi:hypothetical protein